MVRNLSLDRKTSASAEEAMVPVACAGGGKPSDLRGVWCGCGGCCAVPSVFYVFMLILSAYGNPSLHSLPAALSRERIPRKIFLLRLRLTPMACLVLRSLAHVVSSPLILLCMSSTQ